MSSRQNETEEVFASSTRTGKNAADVVLPYHQGITVAVDVTATNGDGTEDLAVRLRSKDPVTDKAHNLLTDEFTDGATGTRFYMIHPAAASSATAFTAIEEVHPGRVVEVELETLQGGASSDHTYSVGAIKLI